MRKGYLVASCVLGAFFCFFSSTAFADGWKVQNETDKMSGAVTTMAVSPRVLVTPAMGFPYKDAQGELTISCSGNKLGAAIGLTLSPNLVGGDAGDGFSIFRMRLRTDNKLKTVRVGQPWGSSVLIFPDKTTLQAIMSAKNVLLELPWYGQDNEYLNFSMEGAAQAIKQVSETCHHK